jgi:hypothetical protein
LARAEHVVRLGTWVFPVVDADVLYRPGVGIALEWTGANGQTYTHPIRSLDLKAVLRDEVLAVKMRLSLC